MNTNFGKYEVPATLQRLVELEKLLSDPEQFYLGLHFYLSLENDIRYFNTPSDVVVFGNIGVDGVHYGFLTDYGLVMNLEKAPIVCVCPVDFDRPVRIIAQSLSEFLRLNVSNSELFYNEFNSEGAYLAAREQWEEEEAHSFYHQTKNETLTQERVENYLMNNFQLPFIENPFRYIQEVELERKRNVSIATQDGLGIITPLLPCENHKPFEINKEKDLDLNLLREYLNSAPVASRLAVFRDIQFNYVLQDYPELFQIVIETMVNLGLIDEVNRLSESI